MKLVVADIAQNERSKAWVFRQQPDLSVAPATGAVALLLAPVALDRVAASCLGVVDITVLHQDDTSLAGTLDRTLEEAPGAIGDSRLHGAADDLRDEHPRTQPAPRVGLNPAVGLDRARGAKRPRRGLEREKRDTGAVLVLFFRQNPPEGLDARLPRRRRSGARQVGADLFVDRFQQMPADQVLEVPVVDEPRRDLVVLLHPVDEQAFERRAAEHALQFGRRLAPLRAVGLVDDDGVAAPGDVADLLRHKGELLQSRDDDRHACPERPGVLGGVHVDLLDHSLFVFDLVDRVLELLVEHQAVGNDDDRIEDLLVLCVVEARQPVGDPGDGIALAAAGRVLDQIVGARAA